jgi:hypothetical protein
MYNNNKALLFNFMFLRIKKKFSKKNLFLVLFFSQFDLKNFLINYLLFYHILDKLFKTNGTKNLSKK